MSTALMPRTAGRHPDGLVAYNLDDRPCVTNDPRMWDTGDKRNNEAIWLCKNICPRVATCKPEPGEIGMIRGGTAYGDRGQKVTPDNLPEHHHDLIARMRADRQSFEAISSVTGIPATSLRDYCRQEGIATAPPGRRVADDHDTIARLRAAGHGWTYVADVTGHNRQALISYWARWRQRQEVEATYLHEISRCEHRPEWCQPGGLCGGCGKDDFAEMEEAA